MIRAKKLIFAVTNDLSYDQRMIRICTSLSAAGYHVTLVGRKLPSSVPLATMPYHQYRWRCLFNKGAIFYGEFNIRLFFYLLYTRAHLVCAVDLDTILPCYLISVLKNIPRVYDAHELFTGMKEVVTRPSIQKFWKRIEQFAVPRFKNGYTVNDQIAAIFSQEYGVRYETIRNLPTQIDLSVPAERDKKMILYQGAVNEGRCFETLIPAFKTIDAKLVICGEGNFMTQAKQIVTDHHLEDKIEFTGALLPAVLRTRTRQAYIGVNIIENNGLNNKYSLANRFFDYIQSALPQVCVDYPAYREITDKYPCALLINDTSTSTIAAAINKLLTDEQLYQQLQVNCLQAAGVLHWKNEEEKLLTFYQNIFESA